MIVKVGADGEIDLTNTSAGTAELVADVEGYYGLQAADGFTGLTPNRVLDTRTNHAALPANGTTRVYFGQLAGVSAVTLNLTAVNAKQSGYITAYPDGSSLPKASNVNFAQGLVTQNEAIVKVGADGYVDFTNTSGASVDLIVDLTGYFGSGPGFQYPAAFVPLAPTRVLDTRTDSQGALQPFATRSLPLLGKVDLRQGYANLVAANVTVTHPTASGYLTAFATETDRPTASVLNFSPGQTVPNATIAYTGLVNSIDFYNGSNGTVDLIVDVYGYYN